MTAVIVIALVVALPACHALLAFITRFHRDAEPGVTDPYEENTP